MKRKTKDELKLTIILIPLLFLAVFLSFNLCNFIKFMQREILFKNNILITSLGLYYTVLIFALLIFYILINVTYLIIELKKFSPDITKLVKKILLQFLLLIIIVTVTVTHYIRIDNKGIYYNKLISVKEINIDFNEIQSVEIYARKTHSKHTSYFSPVMNIKTIDTKIDIWEGGRIGAPKTDEILILLNILKENHIEININNNFNNEMVILLNKRKEHNEIIKIFNFNE